MTTEYGNSDASRASEGRGLSRRQMIKASAVAGAVAWTAPVIVDSLSSPAAALSSCVPYFVKVAVHGSDPHHCPGSGTGFAVTASSGTPPEGSVSFDVSGAKWAGVAPAPSDGCSLSAGAQMVPTVASFDSTYYSVKLNPTGGRTCSFSTLSNWQIGGRYGTSDAGDRYVKVTDRTTTNGYGYFTEGADTAYIHKNYPTDSSRVMQYAYVMFCCDK